MFFGDSICKPALLFHWSVHMFMCHCNTILSTLIGSVNHLKEKGKWFSQQTRVYSRIAVQNHMMNPRQVQRTKEKSVLLYREGGIREGLFCTKVHWTEMRVQSGGGFSLTAGRGCLPRSVPALCCFCAKRNSSFFLLEEAAMSGTFVRELPSWLPDSNFESSFLNTFFTVRLIFPHS